MVETLLREGTTSVPSLTASLPISRQAVAKHLSTLDHAGLVERAPASGREVRYRLREHALAAGERVDRGGGGGVGQRLSRLREHLEGGA